MNVTVVDAFGFQSLKYSLTETQYASFVWWVGDNEEDRFIAVEPVLNVPRIAPKIKRWFRVGCESRVHLALSRGW